MVERIKIKKITLENFESHSLSEIFFSDGLQIILGNSCSGKSSILRSILTVTTPNSFCTSWVREGYPFCRIRIETTNGFLECEKGTGINKFSYWIEGETPEVVNMKAPNGKEFEIAQKIIGMGSIRIENPTEKKKTNKTISTNQMRQSDPAGLLKETGRNKAFVFDTLCGILDSEDIREGLKTTINDLKKTDTELVSSLSMVKLGGIAPLKVSSAREEYNLLADSFDDIDCQHKTFIEIMTTISIKDDYLKELEVLGSKLFKDCWLPDGGVIDLYRDTVKRLLEGVESSRVLLEGYRTYSDAIQSTSSRIQSLGDIDCKGIDGLKVLADKLFHVEQFLKMRDGLSKTSNDIEKLETDIDLDGLKTALEKKQLLDQWKSICREILDSEMKVKKLAVVCSCDRANELTVAIEGARDVYKKRSSLQVAIGEDERTLARYDVEIKRLEGEKDRMFDGVDTCPISGKPIGSECSVWEFKQKGKE